MAGNGSPAAGGSSGAGVPSYDSGGSDSEWDYEYSATEAETFYVTLDLSKPDFIGRQQRRLMDGGVAYRQQGIGEVFAKKSNGEKKAKSTRVSKRSGGVDAFESESDSADEGGEHDDQADHGDHGADRDNHFGQDDDDTPHQVQILDLHSEAPIISYKGRVFLAQWSENIGTELLLTKRDESNPLPAIRQLAHGVDLLAASSARLTTTEKELKERKKACRPGKYTFEEPEDHESSETEMSLMRNRFVPPPQPEDHAGRVDQGDFLARLMLVKQRKGETDEVTVIAKSAETIRAPPRKRTADPKRLSGPGKGHYPRRPRGGKARGRKRGRGRPRGFDDRYNGTSTSSKPGPAAGTPIIWSDVMAKQHVTVSANDEPAMDVDEKSSSAEGAEADQSEGYGRSRAEAGTSEAICERESAGADGGGHGSRDEGAGAADMDDVSSIENGYDDEDGYLEYDKDMGEDGYMEYDEDLEQEGFARGDEDVEQDQDSLSDRNERLSDQESAGFGDDPRPRTSATVAIEQTELDDQGGS